MRTNTLDDKVIKRMPTGCTNFSSTISAQTRLKIITEAKPLLEAQQKCKGIWEALQIADYKKEGTLNDAALKILMEKQGKNITDLLLVKNVEEILDLFDEDEDGFLNEDEQIMLFSAIKERMQLCSEDLCKVQEYSLFKDIMRGIRLLEEDINFYQKTLRDRNQKKELSAYHEIGKKQLKKFNMDWEQKFVDLENDCQLKMQELIETHAKQTEDLNLEIEKSSEILK